MRLVGADEHIYAFHADALQWLADTDLLEMLVDKLSPPVIVLSWPLHIEQQFSCPRLSRLCTLLVSLTCRVSFDCKFIHSGCTHVRKDSAESDV